jgi:hypothetical protein
MTGFAAIALAFLLGAFASNASESEELTSIVQNFLSNSHNESAHERLWGDDLVYSSSSGNRFGKVEIMGSFDNAAGDEADGDAPDVVFTGKDFKVQLYGETAVVAFRLVATTQDGAQEFYYNTATFVRRDGVWKAVAWQATKIPSAPAS